MAEAENPARLASLAKTAVALNRVSNSLNTKLDTVEKRLIELNIGLEVWVARRLSSITVNPCLDPHHGKIECYLDRQLGFAKLNGKWCLAVRGVEIRTGYFEGDINCPSTSEHVVEQPIPLAQASRQERIEALSLLEDLYEALEEEAKRAIQIIEEAEKLVGN
jgi:hypothetical protein